MTAWQSSHAAKLSALVAIIVAVVVGALHTAENFVYLRHLLRVPDKGLAQAAALQTENGFYYSYYNDLVHAHSFREGLSQIIWDQRSEYPDVLNALRRFNVYQEVVLALQYRFLQACRLDFVDEWAFFRWHILVLNGVGHGALAMLSSEISGNPLAGIACFIVSFLNRFQISRLGNYSSSNLRELWGVPILWMQTLCLWRLLLRPNAGGRRLLWWSFRALTFAFIVSWQFSPFLLLLQATAMYFVYLVCDYITIRTVLVSVINEYAIALAAAVLVHFGSPYLLTSPFLFQLVAFKVAMSICIWNQHTRSSKSNGNAGTNNSAFRVFGCWILRRLGHVAEGLIAVAVFLLIRKACASFATADTHVYEILCTKVSAINDLLPATLRLPRSRLPTCAEPSFNARLYLIMGVFNLIERQSLEIYYLSSAGPAAALTCVLVILRCVVASFCVGRKSLPKPSSAAQASTLAEHATSAGSSTEGLRKRKGPSSGKQVLSAAEKPASQSLEDHADSSDEAALLFFVVQFLLLFALGALINRLRAVFGPPMMVLAACSFGPRLFPSKWMLRRHRLIIVSFLFLLHGAHVLWMSSKLPCIHEDDGVCKHLSDKTSNDGDLADLCDWINDSLEPTTPVLSSMNLAGSLRLFTALPLVIHPQFESENLRKRVQLGYELYHCGTEESFAHTMRKLHAEVVIFEYERCFFTPYLLDDKQKNCKSGIHAPEEQLCVKLHANPRHFRRIFTNGGYAVFRLQPAPLEAKGAREPSPSQINNMLASMEAWRDYIDECTKTQKDLCGARLLEAAATWQQSMNRKNVATVLRRLADQHFPDDGHVAYYLGRYLDYDASKPDRAMRYYEKAIQKFPNNPVILKEWIMFLEETVKDTVRPIKLLKERKGRSDDFTGVLEMEGAGVGAFLCEAAVTAKNAKGLKALGDKMWDKAVLLAPLSNCIKHNWQLVYGETESYDKLYTPWYRIRMLINGGVQHEVGPKNQPTIRFLGERPFRIAGNKTR